jgi:hypothetical protein
VRLPTLQTTTELDIFLAALFSRRCRRSWSSSSSSALLLRGTGMSGALKG